MKRLQDLISLNHPVADADLGKDIDRLGRILLDLATDVRHVDAQNLIVAARARTPQLPDQIVIRQDLSGMQPQKRVFATASLPAGVLVWRMAARMLASSSPVPNGFVR